MKAIARTKDKLFCVQNVQRHQTLLIVATPYQSRK